MRERFKTTIEILPAFDERDPDPNGKRNLILN